MADQNTENWKKLIVDEFCTCEEPEKVVLTDDMNDETCDMCLKCNKEIKPRELDEKEEELSIDERGDDSGKYEGEKEEESDFSEAPMLVEDDNAAYEQDRYESQTEDRISMWGY